MSYTADEVAIIREGGRRLAKVLAQVVARVAPGVTTAELDALAAAGVRAAGGLSSFLGYQGGGAVTPFPSTLCTSINDEVVHAPALPARTLRAGDTIGLDIGMRYPVDGGLCTDMAVTVGVGKISQEQRRLIRVTQEALERGIAAARIGRRVRDISEVIQRHVEAAGYSVVRDLVGHGVGRDIHEDPEVPNFVIDGPISNEPLTAGLVIAIEPMVNAGQAAVRTGRDGWTVSTKDHSHSAHFEHTVALTSRGPVVLTAV